MRLVRVRDGVSLWADQIDEAWTDIFAVQDRIAERVVEALTLRLTPAERSRLTRRETQSGEAYRLYTLGRYHFLKLVPVEIEKGIAYYRQAIGEDPGYAAAYADLADACRALAITSDRPAADVLPVGKEAALKAIALDPGLASAEASLCFIQLSDPGRRAEAIGHARRAAGLEPLSLITRAIEGHVLLYRGQAAEAEAGLRPTPELDSRFWIARLFLGMALLDRSRPAGARARLTPRRLSANYLPWQSLPRQLPPQWRSGTTTRRASRPARASATC